MKTPSTQLIRKHIYNITINSILSYVKNHNFKYFCDCHEEVPKNVLKFMWDNYTNFTKLNKLYQKLWQKYYDEVKIDEDIKKNHNDLYYYHKLKRETIVIEFNGEQQTLELKGSDIYDTWIPCKFNGIEYSANVWTDSNYENGADGEDEITLCSIYKETEVDGIDMENWDSVKIISNTYPLSNQNSKGEWIIKD